MQEQYENRDNDREIRPHRKPRKSPQPYTYLLTTVQITVCVLLLLAALVLKGIGGAPYETAREWYLKNISLSIVAEEQIGQAVTKIWDILPPVSSNSLESTLNGGSSSSQEEKKEAKTKNDAPSSQGNTASGSSSQPEANASSESGTQSTSLSSASSPQQKESR